MTREHRQRRIRGLILVESSLWAAGNATTTGAFLMYFARDLGATALMIGVIAAIPETSGLLRLAAPRLIARMGSRKRTCLAVSILARLLSLGIPLVGITRLRPAGVDPVILLAGCLFASQASQWIAYVAYLSWISDLIPQRRWGRFFAQRNVCTLLVVLVVPLLAGHLRDQWVAQHPEPALVGWGYSMLFVSGVVLMTASLIPLALVPRAAAPSSTVRELNFTSLRGALADERFRKFLVYGCWLALWSGLMQASFFLYVKNDLAIGLAAISLGYTLMRIGQIPVSMIAGACSDRFGNKPVLETGLLLVGVSPAFLLIATPGTWVLVYGTFICWSAWAAVNICQQNLLLTIAPKASNTAHVAVFQAISGLCAGVSGVVGACLLGILQPIHEADSAGFSGSSAHHLLFFLSAIGRITAVLWLRRVEEPVGERLETDPGTIHPAPHSRISKQSVETHP